jgi:hypothetical protein
LSLVLFFVCSSGSAFSQNYKIRQATSIAGQNVESTVFVKGSRKRTEGGGMMGIGGDVATIEQCDLKRTVKVNDKKKQYFISPFETSDVPGGPPPRTVPQANEKPSKGGTVTMTSSIIDTGERKPMFGLTARHVKTSMKMVSLPDACSAVNMQIETDGWYVDLPQFSCPVGSGPTVPYERPVRTGCQDRTIVKETGGGKLGFALQSTTTLDSGQGEAFTQTLQTVEFSKATLDDALFEVPAGYTLVKQENDLFGRPDYSAMMKGSRSDDDYNPAPGGKPYPQTARPVPTASTKRPGVKRIGVLAPGNASEENVSTGNLQSFLIRQLNSANTEAISVGSEAEAKTAGCDFLLTSSFSKLKQSNASKVGGLFGKITNTDTSGAKTFEVQVDFILVSIADGRNVLKNKAANKAGGTADSAAESVLAMEASSVLAALK